MRITSCGKAKLVPCISIYGKKQHTTVSIQLLVSSKLLVSILRYCIDVTILIGNIIFVVTTNCVLGVEPPRLEMCAAKPW